jgi:hypothetical protein
MSSSSSGTTVSIKYNILEYSTCQMTGAHDNIPTDASANVVA